MNDDSLAGVPPKQVYRQGLEAGEIRYLRCTRCGAGQRLLREACTACGEQTLQWRVASGAGVVYAVTEVVRAPSKALQADAPYTLVLVDLAEGPRVMGRGRAGAAIDDAVHARVDRVDGVPLIGFAPVSG
jgi:uncharacterized OB-fold protein